MNEGETRKEEIIEAILDELREENRITAGDRKEVEIGGETWERLSEGDPVKQAVWIREVVHRKGWSLREAAREENLGISLPTISRYLQLLDLTPRLLERVRKGDIAKTTAYKLSKLPREKQKRVEDREKITVKDARDLYRKHKRKKNITDEVRDALKSNTPTTPQTASRNAKKPISEEKTQHTESNDTEQEEIPTAKVATSMDVPWVEQPQKRKAKVVCPTAVARSG